jgi:hypothetical protein
MNGCTNAKAVNYNPLADQEDYSCIYLEKVNGVCYAFRDIDQSQIVDQSFTLSYSLESKDFVFFHDYVPDFYFTSRDQLFNLKDKKIYIHHKGAPGVYHDGAPRSFFIDAVFRSDSEMILNSVQWISEVLNQQRDVEFTTLTHITIWNSQQCSGRIALRDVFENLEYQVRKTQGIWSFNEFKDMLKSYGTPFLLNIFNNFAVDGAALDLNKPWYEQDLLHDNWFVIRFEFDNTSGNQFIFHGADINADKSYR